MDPSERTAASAARRIPLRDEDLDGEPSLFVPRWTTPARAGRVILLGITGAALAGAVYAAVVAAWGWLILLALVVLLVGSLLLRDSRRMPYDGGVWLTPTRVAHRWGGRTWTVGWGDIAGLGIEPESGDVRLELRSAPGGSAATVSTHLLVMSSRALVTLVESLVDDPAQRAALGTAQARERAEEIRDLVDRPDFRPAVHNAPRPSAQLMLTLSLVLAAVVLGLAALGRAT